MAERTLHDLALDQDRDGATHAVRACRDLCVQLQDVLKASAGEEQSEVRTALGDFVGVVSTCLAELTDDEVAVVDACRRPVERLSFATALCVGYQTAIMRAGSEEATSE